jgi:hypothetical protein
MAYASHARNGADVVFFYTLPSRCLTAAVFPFCCHLLFQIVAVCVPVCTFNVDVGERLFAKLPLVSYSCALLSGSPRLVRNFHFNTRTASVKILPTLLLVRTTD